MKEKIEMFTKLQEAKEAVLYCLNNADGLASMHGLAYWAGEVERLRKEVKSML